jgi:hypothetical protein
MTVTIPDDKCRELLDNLMTNWSSASGKNSFFLLEATSVLGLYTYLCCIHLWGIFLFQNLYNAMSQALSRNAAHIWHSPAFQKNCGAVGSV